MVSRASRPQATEQHARAARLTSEQVSAINRFPDDNPNPVMRYDAEGHLRYANPASAPVLKALGLLKGTLMKYWRNGYAKSDRRVYENSLISSIQCRK